jgi:hypothetical protein
MQLAEPVRESAQAIYVRAMEILKQRLHGCGKIIYFVIPSQARYLSVIECEGKNGFPVRCAARKNKQLSFSAGCSPVNCGYCNTKTSQAKSTASGNSRTLLFLQRN